MTLFTLIISIVPSIMDVWRSLVSHLSRLLDVGIGDEVLVFNYHGVGFWLSFAQRCASTFHVHTIVFNCSGPCAINAIDIRLVVSLILSWNHWLGLSVTFPLNF